MSRNRNHDRTTRTISRSTSGGARGVRARGALAPVAALALAAALLGGCGSGTDDDPEATTAEQTGDVGSDDGSGTGADDGTGDDSTDDDDMDDGMDDDGTADDPDDADDPADDDGTEDADDGMDDDGSDDGTGDDGTQTGGDENLFEGSWGFGHDSKKLTAEELGDLVEDEAEARGPAEMSLDVECEDGIDTVAGDSEAECVAFADEGVQHLWHISAGPADAGLEIEVTNE